MSLCPDGGASDVRHAFNSRWRYVRGDPSAAVLRRLKATKQKIPKLQFQLGHYANRRAQTLEKPYYLLDRFTFTDVEITDIWPGVKYRAIEEELSTIVAVEFADSRFGNSEDGQTRTRCPSRSILGTVAPPEPRA